MKIESLIEEINGMKKNISINNSIYIIPQNMDKLIDTIKDNKKVPSILLVPYLIGENKDAIYELLNCEFDVEVQNGVSITKKEFPQNNRLPEKIKSSIYPGITVDEEQFEDAIFEICNYLDSMNKMDFSEEKRIDDRLNNSRLYYQIF